MKQKIVEEMLDILKSQFEGVNEKSGYSYRYYHSLRVYQNCLKLIKMDWLKEMKFDKDALIVASIFHDIGKIKTPDAILLKPGRLTDEEFEVMKQHTVAGCEIIDRIIGNVEHEEYVDIARKIARYHHERWDGTGYPDGLSGEEIPLCARIMALADVFDALYQDRCYKKAIRPASKVFEIIKENSGSQFDPNLTEIFLELQREITDISE